VKRTLEYPNFADSGNKASIAIAWEIVRTIGHKIRAEPIKGQTSGGRFEEITRDFLQATFNQLQHIRPGNWQYSTQLPISAFDQYEHLADLERIVKSNKELASSLRQDYIVKPDIVVGRSPLSDEAINESGLFVNKEKGVAQLTPIRQANLVRQHSILHASISCKWTLRSDRSQNARTEALNLIRNRKGQLPHIVAVTAEPLPTRLAALALGTGDLDCVYHVALPELKNAIEQVENEDQADMLQMLINGRRLRDISDLPLDLAV
jgi:hypothetical protein